MPTQTLRPLREVAQELAAAHRAADPETTRIKLFSSAQDDEIRLLEISTSIPTTGEILPYRFASDEANGINYPSTIILVTPDEWRDVENGVIELPLGWPLSDAEDIL